MKSITLIRHAKSSWEFPEKDFDRDLTSKGIYNATRCALLSIGEIENNSIIWSITANRAIKTAAIFLKNWNLNTDRIQLKDDLYTFEVNKLEQIVKSCPNSTDNLILFGHNSAITDFVNKFGDIFIDNVPTSGFVSIKFEINNWSELRKGHTTKILFPRDI